MESSLLGAPLTSGAGMDKILLSRIDDLQRASSRLMLVSKHDALTLLRFSLSAPKILYTLRSSPCFSHPTLLNFDVKLRESLSMIMNISLSELQWKQASLPVKRGGLGIRLVSQLAPSAFLSSVNATRALQDSILPQNETFNDAAFTHALSVWSHLYNSAAPINETASLQKMWDTPAVEYSFKQVLESQSDATDRARLLAVSAPGSSDWLYAYPISTCGLHLDDEAVRVAVGFRLGALICEPHFCPCGALVDSKGIHSLSCKRSSGRASRHHNLNDIIWRALSRANVPALKEPPGLFRSDGKRPDGLTLIPWRGGKCMAWDVTVTDTLAKSYLNRTTLSAGGAAELAATKKSDKYRDLPSTYEFIPIAIETFGPMNATALGFINEIGRKICMITDERRETSFLKQRISIALQRFNAVCFRGSFSHLEDSEYAEVNPYLHVSSTSSSVKSIQLNPLDDLRPSTTLYTTLQEVANSRSGGTSDPHSYPHESMSAINIHADQSDFSGSVTLPYQVAATSDTLWENNKLMNSITNYDNICTLSPVSSASVFEPSLLSPSVTPSAPSLPDYRDDINLVESVNDVVRSGTQDLIHSDLSNQQRISHYHSQSTGYTALPRLKAAVDLGRTPSNAVIKSASKVTRVCRQVSERSNNTMLLSHSCCSSNNRSSHLHETAGRAASYDSAFALLNTPSSVAVIHPSSAVSCWSSSEDEPSAADKHSNESPIGITLALESSAASEISADTWHTSLLSPVSAKSSQIIETEFESSFPLALAGVKSVLVTSESTKISVGMATVCLDSAAAFHSVGSSTAAATLTALLAADFAEYAATPIDALHSSESPSKTSVFVQNSDDAKSEETMTSTLIGPVKHSDAAVKHSQSLAAIDNLTQFLEVVDVVPNTIIKRADNGRFYTEVFIQNSNEVKRSPLRKRTRLATINPSSVENNDLDEQFGLKNNAHRFSEFCQSRAGWSGVPSDDDEVIRAQRNTIVSSGRLSDPIPRYYQSDQETSNPVSPNELPGGMKVEMPGQRGYKPDPSSGLKFARKVGIETDNVLLQKLWQLPSSTSNYFKQMHKFSDNIVDVHWKEPMTASDGCVIQELTANDFAFNPSCYADGTYSSKQCFLERCRCIDKKSQSFEPAFESLFSYRIDAVYLVRDLAFPSVDNALVYKYTNKNASQTCIAENSHSANIQQNLETPASNSGHSLDSNSKEFGEADSVESTEYKMNNIAILLANNAQADDVQGELFTTNIEEGAGDQRLVSNYKMMNTHQKETVAKAERERERD